MEQHTPETWAVEQTEPQGTVKPHYKVTQQSGAAVCFVAWRDPPDTDEEQSHARLIAAAPDLYRELKALVAKIERGHGGSFGPDDLVSTIAALEKVGQGVER